MEELSKNSHLLWHNTTSEVTTEKINATWYTHLMHYIVGLGNPGKEYENTRHNIGFMLLRNFVETAGLPQLRQSSTFSGLISEGVYEGKEITVLLPSTFMNASGSAVKKLVPKDAVEKLMLVYDEIDIPLGEMKASFGRGDGGHNGVKSVIESLHSRDFARLRIGIGKKSLWTGKLVRPKGEKLSSYVLGTFSKRELQELAPVQDMIASLIGVFVQQGPQEVMNTFN